ncbi:MAG TPA: hypothetical protein VGI88_07695 [Verrucomicrobiae bacterium]|jgi:hypothetical protein
MKRGTASAGGGKSAAELVRQSNRWRDNYNAIRGLFIARAVYLLEAADRGDFAELQLVMRKVERRYPALKGLKARRLAALEKLDWEIKIVGELPEGATRADAEAQQKFLRSRYELIENLTETIGFLATAEFRGYAILQKHRFNDGGKFDGAVRELHWLPQDQFSRNGQFGDFYYNRNSTFGIGIDSCQAVLGEQNRIGSEQLPRENFVIRDVDSPLYEIALIAFVHWSMGRKDWAAFTEIFGLPNGVAIMPANIPPGMEDEYRTAAERVPHEAQSDAKSLDEATTAKGDAPALPQNDYIDSGAAKMPNTVTHSSEPPVDAQTHGDLANRMRQLQNAFQNQEPGMSQRDAVELLSVIRQLGEAFSQHARNNVTKQEFEREKIALRRLIESKGK